MKKLLLILICLFVSFEVKSDVLEDLSKTKNVLRLEYSLDKLIPELELEVYGFRDRVEEFDDNRRYRFSEKRCNASLSKLEWTVYESDEEMIVIGCNLEIESQSRYNGENISEEKQIQFFNELLDENIEIYSTVIAKKMFYFLGHSGNFIKEVIFLPKFDNQYYLSKFWTKNKVSKKQKDLVNLLKERIILSVSINSFGGGRSVNEVFFYPFSQKWEIGSGLPKFEKTRIRTYDSKTINN